jgi:hypothetical protein
MSSLPSSYAFCANVCRVMQAANMQFAALAAAEDAPAYRISRRQATAETSILC